MNMCRNFVGLVSIVLVIGGCSSKYTPLWTVNECGRVIVAANSYENGAKLVALTPESVCLIDAKDGGVIKRWAHKLSSVRDIACGGKKCWIGGGEHENGMLASFEVDPANMRITALGVKTAQVNSVAVSSNRMVATAQSDESLSSYNWSGTLLAKVFVKEGLENYVVTFSGNEIFAGNDQSDLIVWDGNSKTIQRRVNLGWGAIMALAVKRGKVLVGGWEHLSVLDANDLSDKKDFIFDKVSVLSCDQQEDEPIFWCGLSDGAIARIFLDSAHIDVLKIHKDAITFVKVKGALLFTAGKDGVVNAWKVSDFDRN